jgi:hypothetical protein
MWFKWREPINWVICGIVFIPLIFALQTVLSAFTASVIALAVTFFLFFYILDKRAIGIVCPECDEYIATNTPWKCGNSKCQKDNERVDDFPFVKCCEHCGVEQKAYKCHHCGELIFLGKDKLGTIYATCINLPEIKNTKPAKKDRSIEKAERQQQEKRDLEHELELTRLKGDLKEAKIKIEPPPKKKTPYEELEEYCNSIDGNEDAERKWRAAIDREFKNDPEKRKRKHLTVDQWMRNRENM